MTPADAAAPGIAVLGSGDIARAHVAALEAAGLRVVTVVGSDLRRAAAVAALAPGAEPGTDPLAAISRPDVVAVDVCGHTADHARWTIAAGRAGRHVMVEKPTARSLDELDAMIRATAGSSLLAGQTVRFQPAVAALRSRVAHGAVGTPRLITVDWQTGHVWPGGWRAWQHDRERSGGHPVHNGTHALDLLVWLTGRRPLRVFARSFRSHAPGMPVPDSFHLTVRLDDGALALIGLSYALRRSTDVVRRLAVLGTEGTLLHSTEDEDELSSDRMTPPPASVAGAMQGQMRHWRAVIEGRCPPVTTATEMRAALAAALAAQRSLDAGDPVAVETGRGAGEEGGR
jgi:predicted dehydrogenase